MNDVEFFNDVMCQTVEEFLADRCNVRRAILACLVVQAMNDHYFENNKCKPEKVFNCTNKGDFLKELCRSDWAIGHVMDIANGVKHVERSNKGRTRPGFNDILKKEAPNKCGVLRAGFPISGEEIFTDKSLAWILADILMHVIKQWRIRLGT